MRTAIDNTGSENVSNCVFSPNDFDFSAFSGTLQRTYRMHSIFDRVEMQAHIDVSTALQVIYEQYGADVDIVKDNSAYFDFYLCVKGTFDSEPREELFWLDFQIFKLVFYSGIFQRTAGLPNNTFDLGLQVFESPPVAWVRCP